MVGVGFTTTALDGNADIKGTTTATEATTAVEVGMIHLARDGMDAPNGSKGDFRPRVHTSTAVVSGERKNYTSGIRLHCGRRAPPRGRGSRVVDPHRPSLELAQSTASSMWPASRTPPRRIPSVGMCLDMVVAPQRHGDEVARKLLSRLLYLTGDARHALSELRLRHNQGRRMTHRRGTGPVGHAEEAATIDDPGRVRALNGWAAHALETAMPGPEHEERCS